MTQIECDLCDFDDNGYDDDYDDNWRVRLQNGGVFHLISLCIFLFVAHLIKWQWHTLFHGHLMNIINYIVAEQQSNWFFYPENSSENCVAFIMIFPLILIIQYVYCLDFV